MQCGLSVQWWWLVVLWAVLELFVSGQLIDSRDALSSSRSLVPPRSPVVILLMVDSKHLRLLHNWLYYYHKLNISRFTTVKIICSPLLLSFPRREVDCSTLSTQQNNSSAVLSETELWKRRVIAMDYFIQHDFDLIVSDLDAVWQADPFPHLDLLAQQGAQLMAMRGTHPADIALQWPATLCMGFLYLRADGFARSLVTSMLLVMNSSTRTTTSQSIPVDDQMALNRVLFDWHLQWSSNNVTDQRSHQHYCDSAWGDVHTSSLQSKSKVVLLDSCVFLRRCSFTTRDHSHDGWRTVTLAQEIKAATVAHCLLPRPTARYREKALRAYGLWQLP